MSKILTKSLLAISCLVAGAMMIPDSAMAARDPAYAAARSSGHVGEKMDGFLGIVIAPTSALERVVRDINARRRQVYTRKAQEQGVSLEAYALTAGCQAIKRTVSGEKYQAPDGSWKTRSSTPPLRDPRCPE